MKKITKLLMSLLMLLTIVGCSNSKIVGSWVSDALGAVYTFNADGTGKLGNIYNDYAIEYKYEYKGDDLKLTYQYGDIESTEHLTVKFEDNVLKFSTSSDGSSEVFMIYHKLGEEPKDDNQEQEQTDTVELTVDELKALVENTLYNIQDWAEFSGAAKVDWDNYIENNGNTYYLIDDNIKTLDALRDLLLTCYSQNAVNEILASVSIIEQPNGLYTGIYGIGGIGDSIISVTASKNDTGYTVTFHLAEFDFVNLAPSTTEHATKSYEIINENGKWVFNEKLSLAFITLQKDCTYAVE